MSKYKGYAKNDEAMSITGLEIKIDGLAKQIVPLNAALRIAESQLKALKAQRWIAANNVTRDQVEMSDKDDHPYFGTASDFGEWMKENSHKRFYEWNTQIYFVSELHAGRMDPNDTATLDDLKASES